jgi:hypothetical protein
MLEVFLSHASQNHAQARRLRKVLIDHKVPVWFSPHHIRGAQQWQDEIGAALARCTWFIVILTPDAVKSMWVKRELNYALIEKRYEERIIPLLFKKNAIFVPCPGRCRNISSSILPGNIGLQSRPYFVCGKNA